MKFVALVSGGKDSCFNILHCLANGHELTCLANLYPPASDEDELDSFMYQTVGHDVLDIYEKCIGVPMYRQQINGKASNQQLEYNKTDEDETEDLFKLLETVKLNHPDVEGVSVGAILSSYQRTRVEDVCSRLGLTSLAYLWQRDQEELMGEMCSTNMDARIIKVAAIGLDDSDLGKSLKQIQPKLLQINRQFGVHICGEGGEFETTVLDAPFFKYGRVRIVDQKVIKHTNDDVWYLKLNVAFEQKDLSVECEDQVVPQPAEIEERYEETLYKPNEFFQFEKVPIEKPVHGKQTWETNVFESADKLYISNIYSAGTTGVEQIIGIFEKLKTILNDKSLTFENIQSSKLLVKNMNEFAPINSNYVKYFNRALPPSRICVETNLPDGIEAQLSVVVLKHLSDKMGLHVQGRSYWAPCNIGPYSQAISSNTDRTIRISGQIPLIPKSMELPSGKDIPYNITLALQHYQRIKDVTGYKKNLLTICFLKDASYVELVRKMWKDFAELNREDGFAGAEENLLTVQVTELPKGAEVEFGGLCYKEDTGYINYDSESEDEEELEESDKKRITIHFSDEDQISEFKFNSEQCFYEIYASPQNISPELTAKLCEVHVGYEIIPVVRPFPLSDTAISGSIAVVEYRV